MRLNQQLLLGLLFLFFNHSFGQIPNEIGKIKMMSQFSFSPEIKTPRQGESKGFTFNPNLYYNVDSFPSFQASILVNEKSFEILSKNKEIETSLKDSILTVSYKKSQKLNFLITSELDNESDSLLWYIDAIDIKYLNIDNIFLLGLFDKNHNTINFEPNDFITISSVNDTYFFTNKNYRVKSIANGMGTINIGDSLYYQYHIDTTTGNISVKNLDKTPKQADLILKQNFDYLDYQDTLKNNIRYHFNSSQYTVLNIWTTYCPPCIKNIKKIDKLEEKYAGKVRFISLLFDENVEMMNSIVLENNIEHQIGFASEAITRSFLVSGYPNYIIVDKNGQVIENNIHRFKYLEAILNKVTTSKGKLEILMD